MFVSRWSERRGQTEPLAALVAVLAVGVAVSLYAGAVPDLRERPDGVAETTLSRVHQNVSSVGVVVPDRLAAAPELAPAGYRMNVSLSTTEFDYRYGPTAPPDGTSAGRRVGVGLENGTTVPGRLTVEVWR